jgi:hypothetical protein
VKNKLLGIKFSQLYVKKDLKIEEITCGILGIIFSFWSFFSLVEKK